jgi:hypothetical protein
MKFDSIHEGRAFRIVVGLTLLVFLMVGVAEATKSINDNATGGGLHLNRYMECCIEDLHPDN